MTTLRLVQLPVPQPAAFARTGNVPLAAGCLAVSARVHGLTERLRLDVLDPDTTDVLGDALLAERVAQEEPEFLGLSLYLWNVERSLHLAREVKRRSPRTKILVGGPEVGPDNPFVLGQGGFDLAVMGEAEETFGRLMARLLEGGDPRGMPNVAVREADGTPGEFGPAANAAFGLTEYPSPYIAGTVAVDPGRSTYVETVRGCKSQCTFCFYPRSSNVLRTIDVEASARLVAELKERGAREIVFLDPTFNHRPEFEPLVEALAEVNADRGLSFFAEVRAEGMTPKHAQLLGRAGFGKIEIGLQSVNKQTLKKVRRGGDPEKVAAVARMLRSEGIDLLLDLIVGLPNDRVEDVSRGVDFLLEHDLGESAQVFPLSLLPGTPMRAQAAEDGIEFDPAPPYRVIRTGTMSREDWVGALLDAERRLGRRLDEYPRPLLIDERERGTPPDVFSIDLDDAGAVTRAVPGAFHTALWLRGRDLLGERGRAIEAVEARLAVDPYGIVDVIMAPDGPFPTVLLGLLRRVLDRGVASYMSRVLAHRGENLQRRLVVVLGRGVESDPEFEGEVRDAGVELYRDMTMAEALRVAEELGRGGPSARVVDRNVDEADWNELARRADPESVAFATRRLEEAWQRGVLGYGEVPAAVFL